LGCGGSDKTTVVVATVPAGQTATAAPTAPARPTGTQAAPPAAAQVANEPVQISAGDGVTLKGHLYSAGGPKRRALLIASTSEQKTWAPHASELGAAGIALLTFDVRGAGETGGSRNDAALDRDIELAAGFLKSRDYPLVYVFGSGPEASAAALKVGARQDLAGLALYSPPASGRADIASVREPKLLMAPQSNAEATAALNTLATAAPEPVRRVSLASSPAGDNALSANDGKQALIDFVLGK
jgi:hypothetical protein